MKTDTIINLHSESGGNILALIAGIAFILLWWKGKKSHAEEKWQLILGIMLIAYFLFFRPIF